MNTICSHQPRHVDVQTVTGTIASCQLGFTLPHEHLINDIGARELRPDPALPWLFDQDVRPEFLWALKERPLACRDNCALDSTADAQNEVASYLEYGGKTVIEVTPEDQGRDKSALRAISETTGATIVAGGGWYLEPYHPQWIATATADELCEYLQATSYPPQENADLPPSGVIGEIGISPQYTDQEIKVLRAACRLQRRTGLPLYIHLPGFVRYGNRVLDIVLHQERVDPSAVVLCHLDPSCNDPDYQRSLAERGVWLEFDMVGMPYRFTLPGEGQSPAPWETAAAIQRLAQVGFGSRILLSHDMFLKTMLRRNGGNGLLYIPTFFLERLEEAGIAHDLVHAFNRTNIVTLFNEAARTAA